MSAEVKSVRLFVAIALPDEIKAALQEVQRELKEVLPQHSTAWTKPEKMHLTLRFLGNVDPARMPELCANLVSGVAGFGELELTCERLGCFPDLRFPRVVWAWVHDAEERLELLHRRVDEVVKDFAEAPTEARYVAHVTLGRAKEIARADAERLAHFVEGAVSRRFGSWRSTEIELIRSEFSPSGWQYHLVERASLLSRL